jgi:hypothetical protein
MSSYILFTTKVNLENDYDLYSACSNPTIVESLYWPGGWSANITHKSTFALPISSTLAYYCTQNNHQDNTSEIRTHAIEITMIFKVHFGWIKDIWRFTNNFYSVWNRINFLLEKSIFFIHIPLLPCRKDLSPQKRREWENNAAFNNESSDLFLR